MHVYLTKGAKVTLFLETDAKVLRVFSMSPCQPVNDAFLLLVFSPGIVNPLRPKHMKTKRPNFCLKNTYIIPFGSGLTGAHGTRVQDLEITGPSVICEP